ncbi:MAG: helix-turn-helix domain-containing protein, partial [Polyangiaceae bacterium]
TLACAVALLDEEVMLLEPRHIRLLAGSCAPKAASADVDSLPLAGHSLDCIERAAIRQTLRHSDGNKANAARTLGIAISTLYEKLKKFGIDERRAEASSQ